MKQKLVSILVNRAKYDNRMSASESKAQGSRFKQSVKEDNVFLIPNCENNAKVESQKVRLRKLSIDIL